LLRKPGSIARDTVEQGVNLTWWRVAAPSNMPVWPHEDKLSFVSVSERMFVYVDDVERHVTMRCRALEICAPACASKAQQSEAAASSSGKPVLLRVDYDAGHGIGSTRAQQDREAADTYAFLFWQTGAEEYQPKK
jgi:hypothetical protein